ncbi:MAG: tetratricopeptide repeat protein [Bacteroidetes bacterium]|nr:tetratricopeptide repeat protein [Bacteroidota bacterium]
MALSFCRRALILTFALAHSFSGIAQSPTNLSPDSLLNALKNHPTRDTSHVLLLNRLAFIGYYRDPVASLKYSFEARRIADSIHYTKGEADAFRQIGLAFWAQADISTAIKYYLTGLKIAEVNHHPQVEADITGNIGTAYNGLGNPQEALVFLNRARNMQQKLNNPWREASVLNNIGDAYLLMKQYDRATESYTAALNNARKIGYKLGITTNLRNLANIYEINGKYDSALLNFFKCIDLSLQIHDNRGFILSHKSIASVYLKTNQIGKAKKYAQIGLEAARKVKLRAFARDLYELQYKISEAEGDQQKAFTYFKLYSSYKDSVQNLNVVSEVDGQRLRFETEKKQSEIELLKKDSELNAERLSSRNAQLVLSILISFLTILSLVLGIRNFTRMKRSNKALAGKNKEIQRQHSKLAEQNDELVALNEEIVSQREEVMAQRDSLAEKNLEIEKINQQMAGVNASLEELVNQRTQVLQEQNKKLSEYAFFNAHKLRAPLARIMGLVNLLLNKPEPKEQPAILTHLKKSSDDLDSVVRSISSTLHEGMNVFPEKEVEKSRSKQHN